LSAGQIAAAMQAVPNAFQAQEAGFNVIGRIADISPTYLLSAYSVRRSWAEKNRPQVVRFLKGCSPGEEMVRAGQEGCR
jgi:ABC-type nitrate/sulfonate/bicarbonate transport system substrate-binding protein